MQNPFLFSTPGFLITPLMPIIIVAFTGILALIFELIWPKQNNDKIVLVSLLGLLAAGAFALMGASDDAYDTLANTVRFDRFGSLIQTILIGGTFLTVLFSESYLRARRIAFAEFYPLVLWSTCGAMLMAMTENLLVVFVGLEILSIGLYVMAGMARGEAKSSESALKYFLLGAFASGFLLHGIAFLYGASGSLHLTDIMVSWTKRGPSTQPLIIFGLTFMLIGLGFKASIVPFHQWTPDVYEGAPTNVACFMATASKVATFSVLVRLLGAFSQLHDLFVPVLGVLAVVTMTVGNVMALTQKDVKRTLGYSSIAQAGYVLAAILAYANSPSKVGTSTITFFLFAYTLTTVGTFAVVSLGAKPGREGSRFEDLYGMNNRSPLVAAALVIFCMSLIGLPLTGGFTGKLQIFLDAITSNLPWLAIAVAINSIISAWYYLEIARAAFTADPDETAPVQKLNLSATSATVICMVGVVAAFFLPSLIKLFGRG